MAWIRSVNSTHLIWCKTSAQGNLFAGSDWGTDTNDLFDDITPVLASIMGNGYTPTHIAMHPLAWADFISNSNVQKYVQAGMLTIPREGRAN